MFSVREKNAEELDYLKSRQWIDEYTRAVRVDLALFNADTELVTSIVHVYEFNSGKPFPVCLDDSRARHLIRVVK